MFGLITSFYLITGVSIAVIVVLISILLVKNKTYGNTQSLLMLSFFVVCFLLIIAMYYVTTYLGENTSEWQRGPAARACEYTLCILLEYSWFRFLRVNLAESGQPCRVLNYAADALLALFLLLSVICCVFFMNDYYYVPQPGQRLFTVIVNLGLMISICGLNMAYLYAVLRSSMQKQTKLFAATVLILLTANELFQDVLTVQLITGRTPFSAESFYGDPSYAMMIITALFTLVYIFRHDFSPAYLKEAGENVTEVPDDQEILDLIAKEKGLSERETDVLHYLYEGYSYESAAQQMFISKYTVKNHAHNVYRKLEINSKSDLNGMVHDYKTRILTK